MQNKEIPEEIVNQHIPVGVGLNLSGPSIDFMIGRVFAAAMGDSVDTVTKKENGLYLDSKDWMRDDYFKKFKAERLYGESNCVLVK